MKTDTIVKKAVLALDEKQGKDIKILKVGKLTILAEYFIIVSATSTTHMKALAGAVEHLLRDENIEPDHTEGKASGWLLLDYDTVMIHIFLKEDREHYGLERLWEDAPSIDVEEF